MCVCVGVCAHEYRYSQRQEEGIGKPLELKPEVAVNLLTWVLGTELRSLARTVCTHSP